MKNKKNSEKKYISELAGWNSTSSLLKGSFLILITLSVFYFLFKKINLEQVVSYLKTISIYTWIYASLITFSFLILSAIRWHFIMKAMGSNLPIKRCMLIIIGIWPISTISPSKSGDFLKAFSLRKEIDSMKVAGTVITERILDIVVLALFAFSGGLFLNQKIISYLSGLVLLGTISVLCFSKFSSRLPINNSLKKKLSDLFYSLNLLFKQSRLFFIILSLTAANWFASILQTKLLFDSVGANVSIGFATAALPIAIFAGLLPITFGGMGTRDTAIVVLFSAYASPSQALTVALLYSFFGYWLLAVLGTPFMKKALGY